MKKIVAIVFALLILVSTAYADTMYVLCKPGDYVNARMTPSTKGQVMGRLECGDEVETDRVTKKDKKGRTWVQIYGFEAGTAWVCAMYLQETPIEKEKCYGYVVAYGRTALRRSPNGKRIKWLNNGDELDILAMSEEWVLTTMGYVRREYLDICY